MTSRNMRGLTSKPCANEQRGGDGGVCMCLCVCVCVCECACLWLDLKGFLEVFELTDAEGYVRMSGYPRYIESDCYNQMQCAE